MTPPLGTLGAVHGDAHRPSAALGGPRRPLWWWLFGVGVAQLVLLAGALALIAFLNQPKKPDFAAYRRAVPSASTELAGDDPLGLVAPLRSLVENPAALQRALGELKRNLRIEASIYDAHGVLVATNVKPALAFAPPRWQEPRRHGPPHGPPPHGPHRHHGERAPPPFEPQVGLPAPRPPHGPRGGGLATDTQIVHAVPLTVHGGRGAIMLRIGAPKSSLTKILFSTLLVGVVIIGAGAYLSARWLGRPLTKLTLTARRLGAGDLSARTQLQRRDEIGALGATMDDMAERIGMLLRSEKELLANVAHELRTPLARIRVAMDIASESESAVAQASLGEIGVDLDELERLVDDVLTTTRLTITDAQPSSMVLRKQAVAPAELVQQAEQRFRQRSPQRALDCRVGTALPLIAADATLLRRVLDNLLDNAHKYSPDPQTRIELTAEVVGCEVCFSIRDYGAGIPAEDLAHVWRAFYRGEKSRSRQAGGVGLGLTLAKRIVAAHGGDLSVASTVGAGSVFTVRIPVTPEAVAVAA